MRISLLWMLMATAPLQLAGSLMNMELLKKLGQKIHFSPMPQPGHALVHSSKTTEEFVLIESSGQELVLKFDRKFFQNTQLPMEAFLPYWATFKFLSKNDAVLAYVLEKGICTDGMKLEAMTGKSGVKSVLFRKKNNERVTVEKKIICRN